METKNNDWCKIIEVDDYQILVKKEGFNHEEDKYSVSVRGRTIDGTEVSAELSHSDEDKIQVIFDGVDEAMARHFIKDYIKPLEDNDEEE